MNDYYKEKKKYKCKKQYYEFLKTYNYYLNNYFN